MEKLLAAVTALVSRLSQDKVKALAAAARKSDESRAALLDVVNTVGARVAVEELLTAWRSSSISRDELAAMLLAASHAVENASKQQACELVWTGPTTSFVSARRTEQALLQVIGAARQSLFVTSFVAYDVSSIVSALNAAIGRGATVSMLLESSQDHGGSISFDAIGRMQTLIPAAMLYTWRNRPTPFVNGRVHAKVAVADDQMCFVTSANLTGHAMEQNMEAGVLITGGPLPRQLAAHLKALVDTRVVSPF